MLLASFVVLTPALARNDLAGLASDLLILIAIVHDTKTRGKPHPACLIGGACMLLVQIGTLSLRSTTVWIGCTNWLASLA
jgi:hypothetical protein